MSEHQEYPTREIYIRGRYCKCQVLTRWRDDDTPPKYLAVNSLDPDRPGEFIAVQKLGAWMAISLQEVVSDLEGYYQFLKDHSKENPNLIRVLTKKFDNL